jgi:hypothetical protein
LASSFNFQGKVQKTFYVLTDDKVGAGPRLRPQALLKDQDKDRDKGQDPSSKPTGQDTPQPMDTDQLQGQPQQPAVDPPRSISLSAKLAAKRKATDTGESASKARR